jgi:polysaccharide deacetylase 2 family uncharacterized protein YibQ
LKNAIGKFLADWGHQLIIVGAGGALGLLAFFLLAEPSAPEKEQVRAGSTSDTKQPKKRENVKIGPKVEQPAQNSRGDTTPSSSNEKGVTPSQTPKELPRWQKFAVTHSPVLSRRMIAVIIDDMGLDRGRTARTIELTGPLTLSFLTYARNLRAQTSTARSAGHELMIHLPMEPEDSSAYAGPKVIKRDLSNLETKRRLDWAFGRFEGYVGLNNHMGSRYTADMAGMTTVLGEIKRRGLLFIDSRTTPKSVAKLVATKLSVPFAQRHVFLDDDPAANKIASQLKAVEAVAEKQGYGIAIGHPYDSTIAELEKWLPTLASRGFVLVPVSAIVRHRQKPG